MKARGFPGAEGLLEAGGLAREEERGRREGGFNGIVREFKVDKYYVPEWMRGAVEMLRPSERLRTSQWAEKNRVLPDGTAIAGPWRNSVTPYLVEIMDCLDDEDVEEVIFVKPSQVGGTSAMENVLGSIIDQSPAPSMVVMPSDDLAERTVDAHYMPMIRSCKVLSEKFRPGASKRLRLKFGGMTLYLTGANSAADLSSTNIKYLFLDEVDKFPGASKRESDPVSLAIERTKTYTTGRKIFMASTPTLKTGRIWRAKEAADVEKHYFVPCPHCGKFIELTFSRMKWPKKEEIPDINERAERAHYICQECGGVITDRDKGGMLAAGRWRAVRKNTSRPRSVAYWLSTLYSPFTRFSDIAREWMISHDDPEMLQNFINSWLGEPWEETRLRTSADLVLERQTDTPAWELPGWTKLITGGIDVQKDCLYWTIRAWGSYMTSQNVAHGKALSMATVENIMNTTFTTPSGERMQVELALMDSGDQTDAVYEFCLWNYDWLRPCKGSSTPLRGSFQMSTVDKAGNSANGIQLVIVDGEKYKSMIAARLQRPNGPGSWMVHAGCDRDYAEQVTSEHLITERVRGKEIQHWAKKAVHGDNHYLDCEVYAAAAADILEVKSLYLQDGEDPAKPPLPAEKRMPEEGWIRANDDWLT